MEHLFDLNPSNAAMTQVLIVEPIIIVHIPAKDIVLPVGLLCGVRCNFDLFKQQKILVFCHQQ